MSSLPPDVLPPDVLPANVLPPNVLPPNVLSPLAPQPRSLSDRLTGLLNRHPLSPQALVFATALLIGGGAGGAMVAFHRWIALCETFAFNGLLNQLSGLGHWPLVFIPALGGLCVGLLRWRSPSHLGQGLSGLLSDTRSQPISPLRPVLILLAAGISLGSGASLGPEGPSVEIGATIGLLLAQGFQVSKERYRLLLGAGAAAGLAAGLNAPIAGVFFALEIVLGTTFTTPAIGLILLSAVIAAIVSQANFGSDPAFSVPIYQGANAGEWLLYAILGVVASGVSLLLIQLIQTAQAGFEQPTFANGLTNPLAQIPGPLKTMLGGLGVGVVALGLPQVLGVGYGTLELILQDGFPTSLLGTLLLAKILLVALCVGSGFVGGIFAPALMIGGCLGGAYGHLLEAIIPMDVLMVAPASAYATVGMAAVLAGSVRAPLTAMILLFEMTQNYHILLPLMIAVGISVWLVDLAKSNQAVETLELPQMGVNLQRAKEPNLLEGTAVGQFMSCDYMALPSSYSLLQASQSMLTANCHTALVIEENQQLYGVLSLADIRRQLIQHTPASDLAEATLEAESLLSQQAHDQVADILMMLQQPIGQICTTEILCSYPEDSLLKAWQEMEARGLSLLPVVEPEQPRHLLGVIDAQQIRVSSDLIQVKKMLEPYLALENLVLQTAASIS